MVEHTHDLSLNYYCQILRLFIWNKFNLDSRCDLIFILNWFLNFLLLITNDHIRDQKKPNLWEPLNSQTLQVISCKLYVIYTIDKVINECFMFRSLGNSYNVFN